MLAWTQAGYFVGAQAVQIRCIRPKPKSAADDLLSDLMDDDDDDDEDGEKDNAREGDKEGVEWIRGDWISSDAADF